jgi:hypothetical protein
LNIVSVVRAAGSQSQRRSMQRKSLKRSLKGSHRRETVSKEMKSKERRSSKKRREQGKEEQQEEERARNVDGFWGTDRVRRVLQKQTGSRIGVKITTAIWRQVYLAIQREWSQEKGVQEMLDEIYEGKGTGEENDWESR